MPLQIKRGTNTQRLAYTPSQGELVFVTDYSTAGVGPLWIGTGDVGTPYAEVSGSGGGGGLTELSEDTTPELGGNLDLAGFEITGTGDVDITGTISSTGTITSPAFVGDLKGSVFADDSTVIIDSNNGILNINTINNLGDLSIANQVVGQSTRVLLVSEDQISNLKFLYNSDSDLSTETNNFGVITFNRNDPINNIVSTAFISAGNFGMYFGVEETGNTLEANTLTWTNEGRLGVGKYLPTAELEVVGDAVITGSLTAGAMLLSGSIIDTSDSSAITVTPAITFSSDVTVENNLIVTNTLTVDTLEVTNFQTAGSGTPELASDTDILLTAGTRVEITQSPLKMASFTTTERNALTPQNGDVIYNTTDSKFQGYAGGTWVDLH
jgi:hypothetical protein